MPGLMTTRTRVGPWRRKVNLVSNTQLVPDPHIPSRTLFRAKAFNFPPLLVPAQSTSRLFNSGSRLTDEVPASYLSPPCWPGATVSSGISSSFSGERSVGCCPLPESLQRQFVFLGAQHPDVFLVCEESRVRVTGCWTRVIVSVFRPAQLLITSFVNGEGEFKVWGSRGKASV
ncbi:hypothetical protein BaRGS_00024823 [Batillaria attramentaria]|uniref:Uncharacterized protein n=1 Tax=Batillaria attramentaria TaxID=370345 RepID=A0ABD0K9Y5_9CAEN